MTNILERLRASPNRYKLCEEAADEIERLERIISRAGDALTTPYADDAERVENARRILEQG